MKGPVYLSVPDTRPDLRGSLAGAFTRAGMTVVTRAQAAVGAPWPDSLTRLLMRSSTLVVVLAPGGLDRWQLREQALTAEITDLATVLVIPPGCDSPTALTYPRPWVTLADPNKLASLPSEVEDALERQNRSDTAAICPFVGLRPYRPDESGLFFGREAETERLTATVMEAPLTVLAGEPGSGRRSLVYAGLSGRLRGPALTGRWETCSLRPGCGAAHALADGLLEIFQPDPPAERRESVDQIANQLLTGARTLESLVGQLMDQLPGTTGVLLHLDGLEWLAKTHSQDSARRFFDLIMRATESLPLKVVATLATPQLGAVLASLPSLAERGRWFIPSPLAGADIRQATLGPAALAGLSVDDGLIEQLAVDAAGHGGHPGRLAWTLRETWRRRTGPALDLSAYHAAGGFDESPNKRAEEAWSDLDPDQQQVARHRWLELIQRHGGPLDTYRDQTAGLFWNRGRGWLDERLAFDTWRRSLAGPLAAWLRNDQDSTRCLNGARQAEASLWLERQGDELTDTERRFILAGARPVRRGRSRRARTREALLLGALALSVVGLGITGGQWWLASRRLQAPPVTAADAAAVQRPSEAPDQHAARATPADRATARAPQLRDPGADPRSDGGADRRTDQAADPVSPPAEQVLVVPGNQVTSVTFSTDGTTLISGSSSGAINLWDLARGASLQQLQGGDHAISAVHFFADGRSFAAVSRDTSVRTWRVPARRGTALISNPGRTLTGVGFSPHGDRLAIADSSQQVTVYRTGDGTPLAGLDRHHREVIALRYSPDGQRLVSADEQGDLWLWETADYQPVARLRGHHSFVQFLRFSGDGQRLLSAGADGHLRLWRTSDGAALADWTAADGRLYGVDISTNGRTLASADAHGSVQLWDAASGRALRQLKAHRGSVHGVAFSPDGNWLATAGDDRSLRLWRVSDGRQVYSRRAHSARLRMVRFSADGRWLAAFGDNAAFVLWYLPSLLDNSGS